jgi:hypothetical protein
VGDFGWIVRASKTLPEGFFPEKYPRVMAVIINMTAMPVVSRVRKFPAPLLPNTVELDPPNTAPMSAPLPVWSKTTRMRPILTIIWRIVTTAIIWKISGLKQSSG